MKIIEFLADRLFGAVVWLLCGPTVRSRYAYETPGPRVYYANHSSNLDALVIWAALPSAFRAVTRPVAARDYWDATALRRFLATRLLRAVLIDRRSPGRDEHPVDQMRAVLDAGESLLIFPEGTRRAPGAPVAYQAAGLSAIAKAVEAPIVPVATNAGLCWPGRGFMRRPGTIVYEILPPIPAGLPRKELMARLEAALEPATDALVAEGLAVQGRELPTV